MRSPSRSPRRSRASRGRRALSWRSHAQEPACRRIATARRDRRRSPWYPSVHRYLHPRGQSTTRLALRQGKACSDEHSDRIGGTYVGFPEYAEDDPDPKRPRRAAPHVEGTGSKGGYDALGLPPVQDSADGAEKPTLAEMMKRLRQREPVDLDEPPNVTIR